MMSVMFTPTTRRTAALVLATALLLTCRPAHAVDGVLIRNLAWRGGAAFAHLHAFEARGNFTDGEDTGSALLAADTNGDFVDWLRLGSIATGVTTTATAGEVTNLSGQSLSLSPAELSFAHDFARLFLADDLSGSNAIRQADTSVNGRDAAVFRVRHAFGASTDYVIGRTDGALLAIRLQTDGGWRTVTPSDWRLVDGVRMPFRMVETGDGALGPLDGDDEIFTFQKIVVDQTFHSLTQRDHPLVHLPPGGSGWMNFRMAGNLIVLNVLVDGHETTAMLDSGAGFTTIDATFARSLHLAELGAGRVSGMGGVASLDYAPALHIEIGKAQLNGVTAGVLDLSSILKMGLPLRFVLGAELFNEVAVDIDYANRRIAFREPDDVEKELKRLSGATILPLKIFEAAFTTPISVDGSKPVLVQLDTGNNNDFDLYPAYWRGVAAIANAPGTMALGGGAGGFAANRLVDVSRLQLGSFTLSHVPTTLASGGQSATGSTFILGNLGNGVLRRFRVIVDVHKQRLILIKSSQSETPFARNVVGLQTVPDGVLARVSFVMPGSPAAEPGLRKGDEIADLDGKPPTTTLDSEWESIHEGRTLHLTLRDGRREALVTRFFY